MLRQQVILDLILFELKHLPAEWNRQKKAEGEGGRREVEGKTGGWREKSREGTVGGGGEGEVMRQGDHPKFRFEEDERQREGRRVDWW